VKTKRVCAVFPLKPVDGVYCCAWGLEAQLFRIYRRLFSPLLFLLLCNYLDSLIAFCIDSSIKSQFLRHVEFTASRVFAHWELPLGAPPTSITCMSEKYLLSLFAHYTLALGLKASCILYFEGFFKRRCFVLPHRNTSDVSSCCNDTD